MRINTRFIQGQNLDLNRHFGSDPTKLFFAKTLSYILISTTVILTGFTLFFGFSGSEYFSNSTRIFFLPMYLGPVFVFAFAYFCLRKGKFNLARNIFATVTILATVTSILFTGGFILSQASQYVVVIPLVVFLLYGTQAGIRIACAIPIIVASQWALNEYDIFVLPNFASLVNPAANAVMINSTLYLLVLGMVASYEFQRNALRKEIEKEQAKLANLANQDPLTNLTNSRHFYTQLKNLSEHAIKNTERLAVIFLDLDNFKSINDNFGHQIGDKVLTEVAARISQCIPEDQIVSRMGGDEFAILLSGYFTNADIINIRMSLSRMATKPIHINDQAHLVGMSMGHSIFPDMTPEIGSLMQHADESMYQHKRNSPTRNAPLESHKFTQVMFKKIA